MKSSEMKVVAFMKNGEVIGIYKNTVEAAHYLLISYTILTKYLSKNKIEEINKAVEIKSKIKCLAVRVGDRLDIKIGENIYDVLNYNKDNIK